MSGKEKILGVGVTLLPEEAIIEKIWDCLHRGEKRRTVLCANPHSIVISRRDEEFCRALNAADVCLPDGAGVVLASRFLGGSLKRRFAGPDFFVRFSEFANRNGNSVRYFFLGSSEETLKRINSRMALFYPHIQVAGSYSPPFEEWDDEENARIVDAVNESGADVLWVGLGAPKQERWIYKNIERFEVTLISAIGAAFDFFAGTKKRSPKLLRDMGFEWLPRLLRDPRRLWKRSFVSTPKFMLLVMQERMKKGRPF